MSRASPSRWWTGWRTAWSRWPGVSGRSRTVSSQTVSCSATSSTTSGSELDEQGEPIEVVDRLADSLVPLARRQREEPDVFIANRQLFGDLIDDERFRAAYLSALDSLHARGARATLESLV